MKLRDLLTKETWNKYGDMDIANDCIDDMACAWCGNLLTDEGKEHFKEALDLEAEIGYVWGCPGIVVLINDRDDYELAWKQTTMLFSCMAGYCAGELYDRWFTDEEEPEEETPKPEDIKAKFTREYIEPMMIAAEVGIKSVEYRRNDHMYVDEQMRQHYFEELLVTYDSGYMKTINVECDSRAAMVEDLYRRGAVY